MNFKTRLKSTLFWSIIAAAFIGPGTVTTASMAGSTYGYSLLWTLLFATLATYLLQETTVCLDRFGVLASFQKLERSDVSSLFLGFINRFRRRNGSGLLRST